MKFNQFKYSLLLGASLFAGAASGAFAEVGEVNIAQQYGISYLPLMIIEDQKLLEKEARAAGLGEIKVSWSKFAGGNVMNDALLAGDLHFASGGVAPLITLWSKTVDNLGVKAVYAMNSMPLLLNTRNPNVKSIKDFSDKDRIALPAVKVSIQAITLQMAAEQAFGAGNQNRLDSLTVSQSHPDGMATLLSGAGEINSHLTAPPFQYQELEKPGVRTVLNSYDVTGGPHTFNVVWTSQKFADANPKTYAAFARALEQAIATINKDKKAAAALYVKVSKTKDTAADIEKMLNGPGVEFTTTPKNIVRYADFMHKIGAIKIKPASWKALFFPNAHHLAGS